MMKRILFLIFLMTGFLPLTAVQAQTPPESIDSLLVDLWPDYDKADVLVLLKGTLPDSTTFPATVTIPLPENADFNVVARIDASDGFMKDDIEFQIGAGNLTFTTPDLAFQIEYYLPYSVENDQRTFNYTWVAGLPVNSFQVRVQQPTVASTLLTEPAAMEVSTGQDGFSYHILPEQIVPAGQPYSIRINYTMTSSQLSAQRSGPSITDVQTTGLSPQNESGNEIDWMMILAVGGGMILLAGIIWLIMGRRTTTRPIKPRPVRAVNQQQSRAQYCHICGQPVQKSDKFCRECGTALKNS